jgi:molybdopterin molybdotransferase
MDGFALAAGPAGRELAIVGESRAGAPAQEALQARQAMRISTGAAVPDGGVAVVGVERAQAANGRVVLPPSEPGANIRRAGEDVPAGEVVLRAGDDLGPAELGALAALGRPEVTCGAAPSVAILTTGDELVEPGDGPLAPGQIRNSNAYALAAQAQRAGARVTERTIVRDDRAHTVESLGRAIETGDVVIVSGGVSVGPHDHVKGALAELGVEQRFWGVSLRPGKPTWFGCRDAQLVFGLPGNPVSAMVTFQLLARPALRALQGADPDASRTEAVLEAPVARHPQREQAVRCRLRADGRGFLVTPTGPQGSHQLTSMLGAGALALVPPGDGELAAGERVAVELLDPPGAAAPSISSPA